MTFWRGCNQRMYRADYIAKGGFLRRADLAAHVTTIEEPVRVAYRGYTVCKCGPWTQGPYLGQALRLLMLGEPIDAAEALRLGLCEEVVAQSALLDRAREIARKLASYSPVAVQSVKAAVRQSMEAPLSAGLIYENEMNVLCFSAGDHMEGIRAFAEKRKANFSR